MPYAEMFSVFNLGSFCGYYVCSEIGNYYLETNSKNYVPYCRGNLDYYQINEEYNKVKTLPKSVLESIQYYNNMRMESEWQRSGYGVY